ncbi:MAG: class I SAM-dependent methyltransferase [Bacillota bacterium]
MYKWNAHDYNRNSSEQQKWAQELICKLNIIGNENILDIGCGDGKITSQLALKVLDGSVLGIDNSEEMINLANKLFNKSKYKNLSFQLMGAEQLNFTEEFDLIFSNAALHWIQDHGSVLKGISSALKKDGRILLQMGGEGNASSLVKILDEIIKREKWKEYFTDFSFPYGFYNDKDYEKWINHSGLKINRIELIPKDMVHKGQEGLEAWIRTTWLPYTERVSLNFRNEFIKEIASKYLEEHPLDCKGLVHIKMIRLEVEAYK